MVRSESKRLADVAGMIREQIRLLTHVADENVGQFADKLHQQARDLSDSLAKVAARYESASGALRGWADDLEHSQADSLQPLARAQQVEPAATTVPAPMPGPPPTPAEAAAQQAAVRAVQAAQQEIDDAKRQLDAVKQHRDERGRYWRRKIEQAVHDGLKDGFWDRFRQFVHDHAGLLKLFADMMTWFATFAVIVVLFLPGPNLAAWMLFAVMMPALLTHTTLAVTGDGSWTDVAFDVVSLLTLSTSTVAAKGLESAAETSDALAATLRAAEGGGVEGVEAGAKAVASSAAGADDANYSTYRIGRYFRGLYGAFKAGGDWDAAKDIAKLRGFAEAFPDTRLASNGVARWAGYVNTLRTSSLIGTTVDQFGHWAGASDTINFIDNVWNGHGFETEQGTWHWSDPNTWNVDTEGRTAPRLPAFVDFKTVTTHAVTAP